MTSTKIRQGVRSPSDFADDAKNRARKIVRPSSGIVRGKFPSRKNGRMVHHEGLLEQDAFYLLEATPAIVEYREQPTTLHYPDGESLRRYTPDLELTLADGEIVFVELKPATIAVKPEIAHKLGCIRQHLERTGPTFLVLTDTIIRQPIGQANLRWIYQRARHSPLGEHATSVLGDLFAQNPSRTIAQLEAELGRFGIDVFGLMLDGVLSWPAVQPLSMNSTLSLGAGFSDEWLHQLLHSSEKLGGHHA